MNVFKSTSLISIVSYSRQFKNQFMGIYSDRMQE